MRRSVIALCCVCLCAGVLAQQTPTFRGGVTLVTVDVSVLDRDGKPVTDLTAKDFEVKLNGHVQPVRALTLMRAIGATTAPALGNATGLVSRADEREGRRTATNAAPEGEPRLFVILVDDLSFTPARGKTMFAAARRFVDGLPASDLVGFTTSSGGGTVNPTGNHALIDAALSSAVGRFADPRTAVFTDPVVGIGEALDIDHGNTSGLKVVILRDCPGVNSSDVNADHVESLAASSPCTEGVLRAVKRTATMTKVTTARQIEALLGVIKAMGSATGIKHLVLLSDGLGVGQDAVDIEPIARAAAEAGVELSVLYEEADPNLGDIGPPVDSNANGGGPEPIIQAVQRVDARVLMEGLQTVADMSGGDFYRVIGTADPFFQRVEIAASAVYRLGVEPLADSAPGKDISVSATVHRPGVTVHLNRHAVATAVAAAPAASPAASVDEQLRSAIGAGQSLYGVPISVATALRRAPDVTQLDLGVNVAITAGAPGPVTTMFSLVDESGAAKSGKRVIEAAPDGSYRMAFNLPVTPGTYRLRVAAADSSGAVGSLEYTVAAKLTTMGPLSASDLLTSWVGADGKPQLLALETLPADIKTLDATMELYPAAGAATPDDVHVRMGLYADAANQPTVEQDAIAEWTGDFLHADAEFAIDSLAPGTYVLRATVMIADKVVGSTSTAIKKR